jgi:hypothetical protein
MQMKVDQQAAIALFESLGFKAEALWKPWPAWGCAALGGNGAGLSGGLHNT